jgi:hypothetical protein
VNRYAVWFRWAVVLGIVQDWLVGLPGIFVPTAVLGLVGVAPLAEPLWGAFASLVLILLSVAYIPGAIDPFRYRPMAIMTVLARAAGVVFFFFLYAGQVPAVFGYIDITFTVLQGSLLYLAYRSSPAAATVSG